MQPWGERTTTELVVAARAGDQRAWSEIMARFGGDYARCDVAMSFPLAAGDPRLSS